MRRNIMLGPFSRTELLLGGEGMQKLKNSTVAIFGVGGVGSFTAEALARSGVGKLVLIDDDNICLTNINRQLHATTKTIGKAKVEAMAQRIKEINPRAEVVTHQTFYTKENGAELISTEYDYVVDAIDTVSAKLDMVERCTKLGIPVISSMGAGNKLNPAMFEVTDIFKTSICPLAKVMRYELRKRGVKKLKVVYSKEEPIKPDAESAHSCKNSCVCPPGNERTCTSRRAIPGSISFVPSVVGLIIAGEVVKDIVNACDN
jgi:tRNA threonylcarbamoyladenosine dehydratase